MNNLQNRGSQPDSLCLECNSIAASPDSLGNASVVEPYQNAQDIGPIYVWVGDDEYPTCEHSSCDQVTPSPEMAPSQDSQDIGPIDVKIGDEECSASEHPSFSPVTPPCKATALRDFDAGKNKPSIQNEPTEKDCCFADNSSNISFSHEEPPLLPPGKDCPSPLPENYAGLIEGALDSCQEEAHTADKTKPLPLDAVCRKSGKEKGKKMTVANYRKMAKEIGEKALFIIVEDILYYYEEQQGLWRAIPNEATANNVLRPLVGTSPKRRAGHTLAGIKEILVELRCMAPKKSKSFFTNQSLLLLPLFDEVYSFKENIWLDKFPEQHLDFTLPFTREEIPEYSNMNTPLGSFLLKLPSSQAMLDRLQEALGAACLSINLGHIFYLLSSVLVRFAYKH